MALAGGPLFAGIWALWLASRGTFNAADKRFLTRLGGALAAGGALLQLVFAAAIYRVQPAAVLRTLSLNPVYDYARYAWIAAIVLAAVLGALAFLRPALGAIGSWAGVVVAFLIVASLALFRDGVRDATLLSKGFDVWQLPVVTNWSVVIIFLVLFVAGLAAIGWLISVVARATKVMESVA